MAHDKKTPVAALSDLLDQERVALLNGDLNIVADALPIKESLAKELAESDLRDAAEFEALADKVARNQALLGAAINGLRMVSERVSEMQKVQSGLQVYNHMGERLHSPAIPGASLEKRA